MTDVEKWTKKKILITVRTYPIPSSKDIEVSCTAGITEDGNWIRIFPVPFRFLNEDQRFKKYQTIEANLIKAKSDTRAESYRVNVETIKVISDSIGTDNCWAARKSKVLPLKALSLCALQRERNLSLFPTLGFFKPNRIKRLIIEPTNPEWTMEELSKLRQYPLFGKLPKEELKKVPYSFKYEFECEDDNCKSHILSCTDWEMGASFHNWKDKYGSSWEEHFRAKYEKEMIETNDTHFYVGTVHQHPDAWIIVGLFYPNKTSQLSLF
ncbi:hypothetical protein [Dehalogenimonas etheniformans]|uniref:Uncharacterized protein n=1 Tax=Dehalogenimonas etheniformans TaxID=1536648 RepID=A0A2P5P7Y6_9CHLR|nr:hypothetical protein [Dehalogenimonas etheniformans]PPD58396.1 hypothetical protein JP09_004635 [Dehalogenimonas etheniformans]QNT76970.1 hypothetical protein HX448_09935 [Dehalogenimonas etheniformans]